MINKVTRWDCICEKCGNTWTTRSEVVSKACPGCKSWTWHSESLAVPDYDNSTYDNKSVIAVDVSQKLADLGVQVGVAESEPDEWEGWSEEQEEYDGSTGETTVFRKQLVRPFGVRQIRKEH